ncbi:hypothetical protein D3C80_2192470 [compost metagenome]
MLGIATGMPGTLWQYSGQRWGNQRADEGRQHDQHRQRQPMGHAVAGVGLGLLLAMESDEDQ